MAAIATAGGLRGGAARFEVNTATRDPGWVKVVVLTLSLGFFATFLLLPLIASAESEGDDRNHGTLEERRAAFYAGFDSGVTGCGLFAG